jgi:nucleotide-binding universal stress UspA family protein
VTSVAGPRERTGGERAVEEEVGRVGDDAGSNVTPEVTEVVVPLDGSAFAARAIGPAAVVASAFGARTTYVRVTRAPVQPDEEADLRAETLPSQSGADWRLLVGDDAGVAVGEYADEAVGSLVCMSSHGRGWPSSAVIGSAAAVVLAATARPLVLVGPACRPDWELGGRLGACVDGEAGTEAMVPVAAGWSAALDVHLTVLTVAEPAPPGLRPGHSHLHHGPSEDPQGYVDRLVGRLGDASGPVDGMVIWDPVGVTDGLIEWLGDEPLGLLVISSHGRHSRPETPLGRTALHIVHRSPVPVLVVPLEDGDAQP